MYCKNCGESVDSGASVCLKCGVRIGDGTKYCSNCGSTVSSNASVCVKCGYALKNIVPGSARKSKTTAGILAILLGAFGAHNFYLGNNGKAVLQLLLSFCFGIGWIWSLIEGIMILTGKIDADAQGVPLE